MATVEDRASSAQGDLWLGKLLSHEALGFCYFKKIHWGGGGTYFATQNNLLEIA